MCIHVCDRSHRNKVTKYLKITCCAQLGLVYCGTCIALCSKHFLPVVSLDSEKPGDLSKTWLLELWNRAFWVGQWLLLSETKMYSLKLFWQQSPGLIPAERVRTCHSSVSVKPLSSDVIEPVSLKLPLLLPYHYCLDAVIFCASDFHSGVTPWQKPVTISTLVLTLLILVQSVIQYNTPFSVFMVTVSTQFLNFSLCI